MRRHSGYVGLFLLCWCVAGCHAIAGTNDFSYDEIVGSWQSVGTSGGGQKHTVAIFGDGTGEGTFHISYQDAPEWSYLVAIVWDVAGASYDVTVNCDDPHCDADVDITFKTKCRYLSPEDKLDCFDDGDTELTWDELTFVRVDD